MKEIVALLKAHARVKLDAQLKTAKAEITRVENELLLDLLEGGLETEEARHRLERMPTVEQLVGPLILTDAVPRTNWYGLTNASELIKSLVETREVDDRPRLPSPDAVPALGPIEQQND